MAHPLNPIKIPELLSPAGNLAKLKMALSYGADAVYVGAAGFSMRPDSSSLDIDTLSEAVKITHEENKKLYVCVNTLMFQTDLVLLENWIRASINIPFDAIILSDPSVLQLLKKLRPNLPLHISTQMSTANSYAAQFWMDAGASRVVLARECSLADLKEIVKKSEIEVEVFVHGAMCIAISGRCLLSAHLCGQSASKGACKHSCRWEWQLVEEKRPGETFPIFETGKQTIFLGSTDLCLINQIPLLVQSGVHSLKIEGRMKSDYYVAAATRIYRAALDRYTQNPDHYNPDPSWQGELESISHRPYSVGFAFGYPHKQPELLQTFNRPITTCDVIGYIKHYESNGYLTEIKNPVSIGETLEWIGPSMSGGILRIESIMAPDGTEQTRALSGGFAKIIFSEHDSKLPPFSILRRRNNIDVSLSSPPVVDL